MFLVVFVTLMVSIIGLYAQIISVQSARLSANQFALMQTMTAWHAAALRMVHADFASIANNSTIGCRVTTSTYAGDPTICEDASGSAWEMDAYLPTGYINYSFYSLLFQTPTIPPASYVVTFASPTSVDASGFLLLPGSLPGGYVGPQNSSGYTLGDLGVQFSRAPQTNLEYGSIIDIGILRTLPSGTFTYEVPASIPVGSIAVISSAQ